MGLECLSKLGYAAQATPGSDSLESGNYLLPNLLEQGVHGHKKHDCLKEPLSKAASLKEIQTSRHWKHLVYHERIR